MKRLLLAALALGLIVVPGADGKPDLTVIRVCGPDACAETQDDAVRGRLRQLLSPQPYEFAAAPAVGAYYVLRGGEGDEPFGAYVRGRSSVRWNWVGAAPAWVDAGSRVQAEFDRVAGSLRPFAQPRPVRVVVDGRLATRPARFMALFGDLVPRARPRAMGPVWVPITILWNRPNPWTEASSMFYDPDDRALFRGGAWFRVPPALVRTITRR
jgi:hypothetical protein